MKSRKVPEAKDGTRTFQVHERRAGPRRPLHFASERSTSGRSIAPRSLVRRTVHAQTNNLASARSRARKFLSGSMVGLQAGLRLRVQGAFDDPQPTDCPHLRFALFRMHGAGTGPSTWFSISGARPPYSETFTRNTTTLRFEFEQQGDGTLFGEYREADGTHLVSSTLTGTHELMVVRDGALVIDTIVGSPAPDSCRVIHPRSKSSPSRPGARAAAEQLRLVLQEQGVSEALVNPPSRRRRSPTPTGARTATSTWALERPVDLNAAVLVADPGRAQELQQSMRDGEVPRSDSASTHTSCPREDTSSSPATGGRRGCTSPRSTPTSIGRTSAWASAHRARSAHSALRRVNSGNLQV